MREIRILLRIHAAGAEVDLAVRLVHPLHRAHDELALRDLVLHRARGTVVEVQVRPSVALRQPHDFGAIVDVGTVDAATAIDRARGAPVIDEGRRLFVDQRARVACRRLHFDYTKALVSALVVLEGERSTVTPPLELAQVERIGEERVVDVGLLPRLDVEEGRLLEIEHVAGLGVEALEVFRLHLVRRRRDHVAHHALVAGAHSIASEVA